MKGSLFSLCLLFLLGFGVEGFIAPTPSTDLQQLVTHAKTSAVSSLLDSSSLTSDVVVVSSSKLARLPSIEVAADTLDPTTMLSDLLGNLLFTPAILVIPIGAALAVAGVVVFFIVSYANPTEPNEEE
eukprot:CAMPEP_0198139714 /NCGR_PEP_ID=MMETSP1443-20131203/2970_1 /TAXON_ID=186043 /ORGANISM="Entomoneis sp., Strain CCMP2396" /LENGTH=127 /DNA_ID=CAMNT_0043801917 /DNA_START=84 /DNA_END=467 /DNA_ORIENTATION=-